MIKVNKRLTIQSREGAEVTILDAGGLVQDVVHIVSGASLGDGTVFGKLNKGFTIHNGTDTGLSTDSSAVSVKVQGNIASGNSTGFDVSGPGGSGANATNVVSDNVAENNGDGLSLSGSFNQMLRNRAVGNDGSGFVLDGNAQTFKQNVAVANDDGFEFDLSGAPHLSATNGFRQNSAIGNATSGAFVNISMQSAVFIDQSNFYGNGDQANNCGLRVDNNSASGTSSVGFSGNFWGGPTAGAGATNPKDNAGNAIALCDTGAGSTLVSAVDAANSSATAFTVSEKPLK